MVLLNIGLDHANANIVDCIAEYLGHVKYIAVHTMSMLYAIDVGLNNLIKKNIKDGYDRWSNNNHESNS
jgi:hypothetical protein